MLARPQRMCQNWSCRGTRPASLCHFQSRTGPRIAAAAAERAASRRVMIISITHTFYPPRTISDSFLSWAYLRMFGAFYSRVRGFTIPCGPPAGGKHMACSTRLSACSGTEPVARLCGGVFCIINSSARARAFAVCITEAGARLFFECADVHTIRFA